MNCLLRGLLAATAATLLLVLLGWINSATSLLPQVDLIGLLSKAIGESRDQGAWLFGSIAILGFGLCIATLADDEHPPIAIGIGLSAAGWCMAMMGLLPMVGLAPFVGLGVAALLVTLLVAVLFGFTLGWTFARLAGLRMPALRLPRLAWPARRQASSTGVAAAQPALASPALASSASPGTASAPPAWERWLRQAHATWQGFARTLQRLAESDSWRRDGGPRHTF